MSKAPKAEKKTKARLNFHPVLPHLAKVLRSLRKKHGLSTSALAKIMGVSQSYISGMENALAAPSPKFLTELSDKYSLDAKQLFLLAGFLHPQFHTFIAAHPDEVYAFFASKVEEHEIPETPEAVNYVRLNR